MPKTNPDQLSIFEPVKPIEPPGPVPPVVQVAQDQGEGRSSQSPGVVWGGTHSPEAGGSLHKEEAEDADGFIIDNMDLCYMTVHTWNTLVDASQKLLPRIRSLHCLMHDYDNPDQSVKDRFAPDLDEMWSQYQHNLPLLALGHRPYMLWLQGRLKAEFAKVLSRIAILESDPDCYEDLTEYLHRGELLEQQCQVCDKALELAVLEVKK